jgi:hypothetical protein
MNLTKNIVVFIFIIFSVQAAAQWTKKVEATNVRLMFVNEKLEITYDLMAPKNEKFYITVNFYNQKHNLLTYSNVFGDADTVISSGTGKKIIWDIKKDFPLFNDNVFAEINVIAIQDLKAKRVFLSSTLFPGSGSTQLTGSKLYLASGVLFYGCLSGSLWFAIKSSNNYKSYKNTYTIDKRNAFYAKAENNRKLSINLLYAGTGVFLLNYGLTYIHFARSAKKYKVLRNAKLSFNFLNYGPPVLSYKLNF